eukprot:1161897-Pelagomonas_calceolata.AAC.13
MTQACGTWSAAECHNSRSVAASGRQKLLKGRQGFGSKRQREAARGSKGQREAARCHRSGQPSCV